VKQTSPFALHLESSLELIALKLKKKGHLTVDRLVSHEFIDERRSIRHLLVRKLRVHLRVIPLPVLTFLTAVASCQTNDQCHSLSSLDSKRFSFHTVGNRYFLL
jgi:hypothetical protein